MQWEFWVRVMRRYSRLMRDWSLRQMRACDYHGQESAGERERCERAEFEADVRLGLVGPRL
jgi:hypothetical protein